VNIELTAGGGGNTFGRKDKIKAKNEKYKQEKGSVMGGGAHEGQHKQKGGKRRE